ncbi:MAG: response regulator [Gammaproteobacteria bacterium]
MEASVETARKRLLIVDDHAILREGLRALLSCEEDLEVIGEATDGREAVNFVNLHKPELVLMDLSMPNTNGTEAIRAIKKRNADTRVIALTVHKTEEYVRATLEAGANGYVLKDDTHQELLSAIRSVLKGETYLSPAIVGKVVTAYLGAAQRTTTPSWDNLTPREREILKLIAEDYKNREIAAYLSLSLKTVEKHRSNLMKKLNLHSASAVTAYAIENGLMGR